MKKKLSVILLAGAMCLLIAASAVAYNESPVLRVKVAAGELPPVEERLPEEPSVLIGAEEIGQYGGTIRVFATDPTVFNDLGAICDRGRFIGQVTEDGSTVIGDLVKGFE